MYAKAIDLRINDAVRAIVTAPGMLVNTPDAAVLKTILVDEWGKACQDHTEVDQRLLLDEVLSQAVTKAWDIVPAWRLAHGADKDPLRTDIMSVMRRRGDSRQTIGKLFMISPERVRQLVDKQHR